MTLQRTLGALEGRRGGVGGGVLFFKQAISIERVDVPFPKTVKNSQAYESITVNDNNIGSEVSDRSFVKHTHTDRHYVNLMQEYNGEDLQKATKT